MERKTLVSVVLLIGVLCWMSPMAWTQERALTGEKTGIVDVWMYVVSEEGVDYLVLELKADNIPIHLDFFFFCIPALFINQK